MSIELLNKLGLDLNFCFPYGSRVYGTNKNNSDYDYLIVSSNRVTGTEEVIVLDNKIFNLHFFQKDDFQNQLNDHKIHTIEAYYHPGNLCKRNFNFELNLSKLRHEFSAKASNSWVKAKKKIEIEKDYLTGWKSLFHSIRILDFGKQIAEKQCINFNSQNDLWQEILQGNFYNWNELELKYKKMYNTKASDFKKVAPKQ